MIKELQMLVQILGLFTAAEFVIAAWFYFRRPTSAPSSVAGLAIATMMTAFSLYCVFAYPAALAMRLVMAAIAMLIANLLFWSAIHAHGSIKPAAVLSREIPSRIVKRGPYAWIRHPFYTSYLLAFLGAGLASISYFPWIILVWLALSYNYAAANEERTILQSEQIGADYLTYLRSSWRWIPFLW